MANPFETVINNICDAVINWVTSACAALQLYILTYFSTAKLTPDPGTLFSKGGFLFFGEGWIESLMNMSASIGYTIGIGLFLAGIIMMMLGFIRKTTDTILSLLIRLVLVIAAIGFGPAFMTEVLSAGWQVLQESQKIVGDGDVYEGGEEIQFGEGMINSALQSQVGNNTHGTLTILKSKVAAENGDIYDFIPTCSLGQAFYTDPNSDSLNIHLVGVDKFYSDGDTYCFDIVKNTYIYYVWSNNKITDAYYVTSMPSEPDYITDGVPYYSNIGISHVMAQNNSEGTTASSTAKYYDVNGNPETGTGVGATYLTCLISVALTKSLVELIFALIMRYVTLVVLIIFDPASCGLLATSWTDRAFWTYKKMYINEVVLLVFSHIWLSLYLQILVTSNRFEMGELVLYVMMWGYLKIGIQLEQKFRDMGLSTTQTAGSLVNELLATGAGVMMAGRMAGGLAKGAARGTGRLLSGGLTNAGAFTGNIGMQRAGAIFGGKPLDAASLQKAAEGSIGGVLANAKGGTGLTNSATKELDQLMSRGGMANRSAFADGFAKLNETGKQNYLDHLRDGIGGQLGGDSTTLEGLGIDKNGNITGQLKSDLGTANVSFDNEAKSANAIPFTTEDGKQMYANVGDTQFNDSMQGAVAFGENAADDAAFTAMTGINTDGYTHAEISNGTLQMYDKDGLAMERYANGSEEYRGMMFNPNSTSDELAADNLAITSEFLPGGQFADLNVECYGVKREQNGAFVAQVREKDNPNVNREFRFVPTIGNKRAHDSNLPKWSNSVRGSYVYGETKESVKRNAEIKLKQPDV